MKKKADQQQKPVMTIEVYEESGCFWAKYEDICAGFYRSLVENINPYLIFLDKHSNECSCVFDPAVFDQFVEIASRYYRVVLPGENKGGVKTLTAGEDPYSVFLRLAPDNVLSQIYKLMVFALHPDRGGDETSMKMLTKAWAEIKKERRANAFIQKYQAR